MSSEGVSAIDRARRGEAPGPALSSESCLQAFRDLTTGTREDENAGSCLQDHSSRRLFGEEHRGRDPDRRRPRLAHAAAGWLVRGIETRGHVEDGKVAHYQVTLKVGFTLDDDD